jgi:transcription elongation factor Elf1
MNKISRRLKKSVANLKTRFSTYRCNGASVTVADVSEQGSQETARLSLNGIDDSWTKVFEKKARYRYVIDMKA